MTDNGMFAPLAGAKRPRRSAAPVADEWRPIMPVPGDAPAGRPQHKRRGKPIGCWTYRDAAVKLLGYVLRFNLPDGGKEFLPATYCQHGATSAREWRFKGLARTATALRARSHGAASRGAGGGVRGRESRRCRRRAAAGLCCRYLAERRQGSNESRLAGTHGPGRHGLA
jgi:hypothetical protein